MFTMHTGRGGGCSCVAYMKGGGGRVSGGAAAHSPQLGGDRCSCSRLPMPRASFGSHREQSIDRAESKGRVQGNQAPRHPRHGCCGCEQQAGSTVARTHARKHASKASGAESSSVELGSRHEGRRLSHNSLDRSLRCQVTGCPHRVNCFTNGRFTTQEARRFVPPADPAA